MAIEEELVKAVEVIAEASREDAIQGLFEMYKEIKNLRAGISIGRMQIDANKKHIEELKNKYRNVSKEYDKLHNEVVKQNDELFEFQEKYNNSLDTIIKLKNKIKGKE